MTSSKLLGTVLIAGWLANALAATDADVEAGIAAYENQEYDEALARFDAARERRPERPELAFNRGLVLLAKEDLETARTAFETASEAEESNVRASAFYELGNMSLDAEEYDAAIESYIEALKARPAHANAKWNLELALSLKKKQEEEQEQEENQDEQNEDEQDEDEQNEDEQNEDEQNEDEQNEDEQEQNEDEQQQDEQNEDEQQQDEQQQDEQNEDEQQQDEQQQDEQNEDEQQQDEQQQDEQKQDEQQQSQPQALDEMDVQKALEQLDEQDPFTLDRPAGGYVQPQKDW